MKNSKKEIIGANIVIALTIMVAFITAYLVSVSATQNAIFRWVVTS